MPAALRAFTLACLTLLAAGCAPHSKEQASQISAFQRTELPPPTLQQPDLASMREADVSPISSTAGADASKPELLGEMSDSTPGAARGAKRPCNFDSCGVVLGIANHQAAESLSQDDGGSGVYVPQGMDNAQTASQPAVVDATGVQKIVTVWDIAVRMRDGTVRQFQQRSQPLLQIGDTVFINSGGVQLWN